RDPSSYSVDQLKNCNLVILILAHRYGTILAGDPRSITEIEYDTARKLKRPVIPFLIDPRHEWPFVHVDRSSYDLLEKFKKHVQENHTPKQFTSPDHLARLVTEAVVHFVADRTGLRLGRQFAPSVSLLKPIPHSNLLEIPDLTITLGAAEDGVPLLLQINRSADLEEFFNQINLNKPNLETAFPDLVIDELRLSLADRRRIHSVVMNTKNVEAMYVTRRSLSIMFRSLMSSLVGRGGKTRVVPGGYLAKHVESEEMDSKSTNWPGEQLSPITESVENTLESTGGTNRFLGISLSNGSLYSVGRKDERWVEWHPFAPESLRANLPETQFRIRVLDPSKYDNERLTGSLSDLESKLMDFAIRNLGDHGWIHEKVDFRVQRQSIAQLSLRIVDRVFAYHSQQGLIHGDLKPSNILLVDSGPMLIDGFDVKEGAQSPGWTPFWSAPEQITGEPLSFSADIYALARLLVEVIGAYLIGEVKKFRVPALPSGRNEFDVFCNSSVHLLPKASTLSAQSFRDWKDFLETALRFDPQQRPNSATFRKTLEDLLIKVPLNGAVYFRVPGQICATEMPDGRQLLARVNSDFLSRRERPPVDDYEQSQVR
ncbi:MAG: DUF4062 domain-containing protein, partial [Pyrinomonadaceae bacterium]